MLLRPKSHNAESYSFIKNLQLGLILNSFIIKPVCHSNDVKTLKLHWEIEKVMENERFYSTLYFVWF